jgi:hypothetical protein
MSYVSEDTLQMVLQTVLDRLEYGVMTDNKKQLKVTLVDSGTIPAMSTLSSLSNIARQGDLQVQRVNEAMLDMAYLTGILKNVTIS